MPYLTSGGHEGSALSPRSSIWVLRSFLASQRACPTIKKNHPDIPPSSVMLPKVDHVRNSWSEFEPARGNRGCAQVVGGLGGPRCTNLLDMGADSNASR
jgi:hypothetical protein